MSKKNTKKNPEAETPKEQQLSGEEDIKEETTPEVNESGEETQNAEAGDEDDPKAGGKLKAKLEEVNDRLLRQMAEFENFRRRSEKEKTQMYDMGAKTVIEKILPVIDNFERGLATLTPEQKKEPFAEGIDKVYTQLMTELAGLGVTPIDALGCEFDPALHNAVMQVETDEYESGVIAQEMQKGYKYNDTVVRHSMVAVAQ
ncbi:MAG: nucleotide exchange factor GrpE [Lachnospiraceae bacterium]|nr:nucleotide exchange factor GrpE [Lachnospiraceae bacterium]